MIMDYQVMFVLSPMVEWTKLSIDFPGAQQMYTCEQEDVDSSSFF